MKSLDHKTRTVSFAPSEGDSEQALPFKMAPLIDIVFLLICFYLLVAQFVSTQDDASVQLPVIAASQGQPEMPAEVVVNVRSDDELIVEGQSLSLAELRSLLLSRKQKMGSKTLRVVVRTDRQQRFGKLDEVLQTCRQAGLKQVIFRVVAEEER